MRFAQNPIIYLSAKVWRYSKGNRKKVILYIILFFGANVLWLVEPLIIAHLFNTIQSAGITQDNLWQLIGIIALIFATYFIGWLFHGPARVIENQNSYLARVNYKQFLLDGVMNLSPSWHTDHHSGDTIDKIEKGTKSMEEYARHTYEVIELVLHFSGSYIALIYFNVHAAYIVPIVVASIFAVVLSFDRVLIKKYRELNSLDNRVSAKVYDVISNITTVIILRIEKMLSKAINKKMMKPYQLYRKTIRIDETKWFVVSMLSLVMIFGVLASYMYSTVAAGTAVMVGTIFALYGYVKNIEELFYRFAYKYGEFVRQKASVENAEELVKDFEDVEDIPQVKLNGPWKEIHVEHVQFSYHTTDGFDPHLDDIDFAMHKGEKIAFIGESGGGKTTTMKLIRGLYNPQKGKITLDGKKLEHGFLSIRDSIALIPQDPEIFNSTIRENITMGVRHTMPVISRFAKMARFHRVAEALPKKYLSSIVEKGVNLSGGEKQRLALTRGLLASEDKSILLLDEPTSSVDPKNELEIYQSIFNTFSNKTVISSIHRLHLLPLFDTIYVFSKGTIVDSGSFEELKTSSPIFKKLWQRYQKAQKTSDK